MDTVALILSIVGCLNWGLVGIFGFDLVAWLFGGSGGMGGPPGGMGGPPGGRPGRR